MNISLKDLRRYAMKTQIQAARLAETTQSELSRFERRDDFRVSTLRRYIAGLGGSLELTVSFGSSSFRLVPDDSSDHEPDADDAGSAIDALELLVSWLPALVAHRSRAQLNARPEGCGKFSLAEHIWHLHDVELERYAERLRRVLSEDEPRLPDFHDDRLAERCYDDRPIAPALRALVRARRQHVAAMRCLDAGQLRRAAVLQGVGRLTLASLIRRWSSHDLGHRLEIERLAERLRAEAHF
jgi:hypothetical protein